MFILLFIFKTTLGFAHNNVLLSWLFDSMASDNVTW
jgi:hypothetical protein